LAIGYAVPAAVTLIQVLAGQRTWASFAAVAGWLPAVAALTGGFAMTKILLARRLSSGRERIRRAVVGVEIAMACLGALITAGVDPAGGLPAGFIALAAITGGGLSLAAAVRLMRRQARQYFADPRLPTNAAGGNGDDTTACCAGPAAPASARLVLGAGPATCQA
jgi:hypothetical protein